MFVSLTRASCSHCTPEMLIIIPILQTVGSLSLNTRGVLTVCQTLKHLPRVDSSLPSKMVGNNYWPLFTGEVQKGLGLASSPWQDVVDWDMNPSPAPSGFCVTLPWGASPSPLSSASAPSHLWLLPQRRTTLDTESLHL